MDSFLSVAVKGPEDPAMINSLLVNGGVMVFHLSVEQPSLEDIFMGLTDGKGGDR